MLISLYLILAAAFGGWLYRWRGGGWPVDHIPRLIKTAVCALPYALLLFVVTLDTSYSPWIATIITFLSSWFFLFQGHGAYQDAGTWDAKHPNHKPQEYIGKYQEEDFVRILREAIPSGEILGRRDLYEFFAMGFTGFLITLIPGLSMMITYSSWLGILLALSGFTKGLGYAASYIIFRQRSALGEILAGAFLYSSLMGVYLLA